MFNRLSEGRTRGSSSADSSSAGGKRAESRQIRAYKGRSGGKWVAKRALIMLLCLATVASMCAVFPAENANAEEEKDYYGFPNTISGTFDPNDGDNPYGQGKHPMGTKHESYISWQDNGDYDASVYNFEKPEDFDEREAPEGKYMITDCNGNKTGMYLDAVAYDADKTGRDSYVAEVEYQYDGKNAYLNVLRRNCETNDKKSERFWLGDGGDVDHFDDIEQHAYKSYFNITAGDYNGDGKDELAVYIPRRYKEGWNGDDMGGAFIRILDGKKLTEIKCINLRDVVGDTAYELTSKYKVDKRTANAMLQVNMDSADIDRDGDDDLVFTTSFADIRNDTDGDAVTERNSKLTYCKGSTNKSDLLKVKKENIFDLVCKNLEDPENSENTSFDMRTCSVACGDLELDGVPDIVVAGYYNYQYDNPGDRDRLRDENFLVAKFTRDVDDTVDPVVDTIKLDKYQFLKFNEFTDDGFYNSQDDQQGPPALCCVAMNGRNEGDSIFLSGTFYDYIGGKFTSVKTTSACSKAVNTIRMKDGYDGDSDFPISNTWVDDAVAGNFDSNPLGVEQVLYTTGYKQASVARYTYRANYAGYSSESYQDDGKEMERVAVDDDSGNCVFYESGSREGDSRKGRQFVTRTWKSDGAAIAIAAVDADRDTDILEYKSKEYTFANPQVLALLQAAPYFGDLDDAGYGYGDNCSTSIGKSLEEGHSTVSTTATSAGPVISGGFKVACLKFDAEVSFTHEWSEEHEKSTSQTWSWEVENTGKSNKVVLVRTPVIMYYYDVECANGEKDEMAIGVQQKPSMIVMTVDRYNDLVRKDPKRGSDYMITEGKDGTTHCTVGQPSSYPRSGAGLEQYFASPVAPHSVSNTDGNGSYGSGMAFEAGVGQSDTNSYSNELEVTAKVGFSYDSDTGNGVEILVGSHVGKSWGGGTTTSIMDTVTKSGYVAAPPEAQDQEYGFNWKLAMWKENLGSGSKALEFPVVGYEVNEVVEPLSIPRNVTINEVTSNAMTISWEHGYHRPTGYEIFQFIDDPVTGPEYIYLGTVDGDTTVYKYSGLEPETTYDLCVRAYELKEGKARYSLYTAPVSATTMGESEMPIITMQPQDQSVLVGDDAQFSVVAKPSENATELTYTWQQKLEGTNKWENIGSKDSRLDLEKVTKDMDGNEYRVVVGELLKGTNKKVNAYSESATLYVGKTITETTASALNTDSRRPNEYLRTDHGLAGKTETKPVSQGTYEVNKEIKVRIGEKEYEFTVYKNSYSDDPDPKYIYYCEKEDNYYLLIGLNEEETAADQMVLLTKEIEHFEAEDAAVDWTKAGPDDLQYVSSDSQTKYVAGGQTYDVYTYNGNLFFKISQNGTDKWFIYEEGEDGNFTLVDVTEKYVRAGNGTTIDFLSDNAEPMKAATETIGTTRYLVMKPEGDAFASDGYKAYVKFVPEGKYYYKKTNNSTLAELDVVTPQGTYIGEEDGSTGTYAYTVKPGDIVKETKKNIVDQTTTTYGDEVTLSAQVTAQNEGASVEGPVVFNIRNKATGAETQVTAQAGADGIAEAKWKPLDPGVYEIIASYGGNDTSTVGEDGDTSYSDGTDSSLPSQGKTLYYALDRDLEDPLSESIYVLSGNDVVYGDKITLDLDETTFESSGGETHSDITNDSDRVSYQVTYIDLQGKTQIKDLDDNTYVPVVAGQHVFTATVKGAEGTDDKTVSFTTMVSKRPITVAAPSKDNLAASASSEKIPDIADVTVGYTGDATKKAIIEADQDTLKIADIFDLSSTPNIKEDSPAGTYSTVLSYKQGSASQSIVNEFKAKYNAVLQSGAFVVEAGVFNVTYDSGSNGSIKGYQGDRKRVFATGAMITEGTLVTIGAIPDENFIVDEWTVLDGTGNPLEEGKDYIVDNDGKDLIFDGLKTNLDVNVTFKPSAYKLRFLAGENGDITGHYYKNGETGSVMSSPETVPNGKGFILNAEPEQGYVVKQWNITKGTDEEEIYKVDGTVYTGDTLTFEKMTSDMKVTVEFEPEEFYTVSVDAVDESGAPVPGCKFDITGTEADGTAKKGSAITITSQIPDNIIIKEWRQITNEGKKVLQGSRDSYSIASVQENIAIEVEVTDFKKLTIEYEVITDDGGAAGDANVLTATSEGVDIASGNAYTAYIPIDFEASGFYDKYQIDKWTVTKEEEAEKTMAEGWEENTFKLDSLDKNTVVKLYLISRPVLNYSAGANGAITSDDGFADGDYFYKYRPADFNFTIKPDVGYEIDEILINGTALAEPSDIAVTGTSAGTSDVTLAVKAPEGGFAADMDVDVTFRELPSIDLSYALYDIGDGVHGKIGAAVDRNGDPDYAASVDPSADGGSLTKVYRDSVITITDNADKNYRIRSWLFNEAEVLGSANLPDYIKLGASDNELIITVTDALINDLAGSAAQVLGQNDMSGGILTYGAKDNTGGTVSAAKADGTNVKYGTIFGDAEEITFTAVPENGCELITWEVNGKDLNTYESTITCTTDPDQDIDVRAVFAVLQPVPTFTLTYGVGTDPAADPSADPAAAELHGSVSAVVSKMPDDPGRGFISAPDYALGDQIASGKALEQTTGAKLTAAPEDGYFVKGWFSDPDCTAELPGSKEELNEYEIGSIDTDTTVYVKFAKIKEFTVNVAKDPEGTGSGTFEVYVDGKKLEESEFLSLTDDAATFEVARHSSVKVTGIPADENSYIAKWNGADAASDSYEISDVTADADIVMTILPSKLVDVEFDLPNGYQTDEASVKVGSGDSQKTINAINKSVRTLAGRAAEFTITPHAGQMVESWKITYIDGTVEEGASLGVDNTLVIERLNDSATVTITMKDIVAYKVPYEAQETYSISDEVISPDTLKGDEYAHMVRESGTATFTVTPAEGYGLVSIADKNFKDPAADAAAAPGAGSADDPSADPGTDPAGGAASAPAAPSNVVSIEKNADGSWTVTVSNVQADIDLDVVTGKLYTVKIKTNKYGKITVKDASGKTIKSGSKVLEGTKLIATAKAKSRCEFSYWNKPFKGGAKNVSKIVDSDITFSGTFARLPMMAKAVVKTKSVKIKWTKIYGAERYVVYLNSCGKKKLSKIIAKKGAKTTSVTKKGLDPNKVYKFKVLAQAKVDGKYKTISKLAESHIALAKNKKYTNPKSIKVKKTSVTLKVGKTSKIKAKVKKLKLTKKLLGKDHTMKLRYKTSNSKVATVSKKGVIKAKKAGNCTVYVLGTNGASKAIKVTVK